MFFDVVRDAPNATKSGPLSARQRNTILGGGEGPLSSLWIRA